MQDSDYSILFVDDEPQTRKMFERLVESNFKVVCAQDVAQAKQILKDQHQHIGVLITDQRMPGELGVDLLRYVRQEYPSIIRLLTTAYSDLDDAIEAVNTGEIFRYINKPWNVDELLIDLRLAMNFFELEQDRSALVAEKVSLSRRQYRIELLRSMIALGSAQRDFAHTEQAIFDLLSQLSSIDFDNLSHQNTDEPGGFWDSEVNKTRKMSHIAQQLNDGLAQLQHLGKAIDLTHDFHAYAQTISSNLGVNLLIKNNDIAVESNASSDQMLHLLFLCSKVLGGSNLSLSVTSDDRLTLQLSTDEPSSALVQQLMTKHNSDGQLVGNLMAVFIGVYQAGGHLDIVFEADKLCTIKIHFSPDNAQQTFDNNQWIEDVFILHSGL